MAGGTHVPYAARVRDRKLTFVQLHFGAYEIQQQIGVTFSQTSTGAYAAHAMLAEIEEYVNTYTPEPGYNYSMSFDDLLMTIAQRYTPESVPSHVTGYYDRTRNFRAWLYKQVADRLKHFVVSGAWAAAQEIDAHLASLPATTIKRYNVHRGADPWHDGRVSVLIGYNEPTFPGERTNPLHYLNPSLLYANVRYDSYLWLKWYNQLKDQYEDAIERVVREYDDYIMHEADRAFEARQAAEAAEERERQAKQHGRFDSGARERRERHQRREEQQKREREQYEKESYTRRKEWERDGYRREEESRQREQDSNPTPPVYDNETRCCERYKCSTGGVCDKVAWKKCYRKMAMKYHPDKNNGDDTEMKKLTHCNEIMEGGKQQGFYDK